MIRRFRCRHISLFLFVCLFCLRVDRHCEIRKRFYSNLYAYALCVPCHWARRCGEKNCSVYYWNGDSDIFSADILGYKSSFRETNERKYSRNVIIKT